MKKSTDLLKPVLFREGGGTTVYVAGKPFDFILTNSIEKG
jgi:hypothetical protein